MKLLHTRDLVLAEFVETDAPPYAILSHRWEDDEVTYDIFRQGTGPSHRGWFKIEGLCRQAAADGFDYCWIDTCCIDKSSSSELSEAINSMYKWYLWSGVCYAYLVDVKSDDLAVAEDSDFSRSRWFTRGWTLQELLAPSTIYFFSRDWKEIGSRHSLKETISQVTGIDISFFNTGKLGHFSTAQKMSWAAKRETTRVEDTAYCLLGIFNVSMPLLYGEGQKAFQRLQEEILRQSDDYSIFVNDSYMRLQPVGFLASSPRDFVASGTVSKLGSEVQWSALTGWNRGATLTNRGIEITLPIVELADLEGDAVPPEVPPGGKSKIALLNCHQVLQAVGLHLWEQQPGVFVSGTTHTKAYQINPAERPKPFVRLPLEVFRRAKLQHILLLRQAFNPIVRIRPFAISLTLPRYSLVGFKPLWYSPKSNSLEAAPHFPKISPDGEAVKVNGNATLCVDFGGGGARYLSFKDDAGHAFVFGWRSGWADNGWTSVQLELYADTDLAALLEDEDEDEEEGRTDWRKRAGTPVSGLEWVEIRQRVDDVDVVVQAGARKYREDWKVVLTGRWVASEEEQSPSLAEVLAEVPVERDAGSSVDASPPEG